MNFSRTSRFSSEPRLLRLRTRMEYARVARTHVLLPLMIFFVGGYYLGRDHHWLVPAMGAAWFTWVGLIVWSFFLGAAIRRLEGG